jgi:predicted DNA-binding transcriptional regulator AlpA
VSKNKEKVTLAKGGLVRQADLIPHIIPLSSSTLWRMVRAGTFPKPRTISPGCIAWLNDEIEQWKADLPGATG